MQVVNETLRVANIIGAIFRRTTTDIDIKGIKQKIKMYGLYSQ